MKKNTHWMILSLSVIGMGMGMPSCPGQQELKDKIESLHTTNVELTKKVQTLTTQVNTLNQDMEQVKQLLPQITNVIQAQKGALDELNATVAELKKGKAAPAKKVKK